MARSKTKGRSPSEVNRPPITEELVYGFSPDEVMVLTHFLGKTAAEIRLVYPRIGYVLTEDFTYMAPEGMRYYLPSAFDYLKSEEASGDSDFCAGLLLSLSSQFRWEHELPAGVLALMKEVAEYANANRAKFELGAYEELFDEHVRTILSA